MIYLDNAASTAVHPKVLDAMMPYLADMYGNPSSIHRPGRLAKKAIRKARKQVASLICADSSEIFFTSGGTESNNMALRGFAMQAALPGRPCKIITSSIEHDAILEPCRDLQQEGLATISYVPVDLHGTVDVDVLLRMLGCPDETDKKSNIRGAGTARPSEKPGTAKAASGVSGVAQHDDRYVPARAILVSIMYANNEVGTVQPVPEIAGICNRAGVAFHTDAVQAAGKIPIDVTHAAVDMMSLSSHKIHGPKGVGALYVRNNKTRRRLAPRILGGGGQESGMRSGTENVSGIVGFGAACGMASENLEHNASYMRRLRDTLAGRILQEIPQSVINGSTENRLPGNAHFTFLGVNGEDLLIKLDEHGVAASTGSACSVNTQKASHVLAAMGFTREQITGSLRLTPSAYNTESEIDKTVDVLVNVIGELRRVSPLKSKYGFDED